MSEPKTLSGADVEPLAPERSFYLRQAAAQARQVLAQFSGGAVDYHPTALQLLDEWLERKARQGPVSAGARALAIAFLGHTFLTRHGGYWAVQRCGSKQALGVVCPVVGRGDQTRFVDIAGPVDRRIAEGITASLAFFYLSASVDLQGHS